jgi:hypothetical protein
MLTIACGSSSLSAAARRTRAVAAGGHIVDAGVILGRPGAARQEWQEKRNEQGGGKKREYRGTMW